MPTMIFLDLEEDFSASLGPTLTEAGAAPANSGQAEPATDLGSPGRADFYGLPLLKHFDREIFNGNLSKLAVPIAFVHVDREEQARSALEASRQAEAHVEHGLQTKTGGITPIRTITYLQHGATDVIQGPFDKPRLAALGVHAYRAHIQGHETQAAFLESRRERKRSWVGVEEEKPYAHLRENM